MFFFKGISTTFPGPTVQGPPIKETNLVFIPTREIKAMETCKADPEHLFSLFSLGL